MSDVPTAYCLSPYSWSRFRTRVIQLGETPLGGDYPVRVQSMTNTPTQDIHATVKQCIRLAEAGAEYIRITTPARSDVECLAGIKKELRKQGFLTPLIADVHFNPKVAEEAARIVEKVRINPGNYVDRKKDKVVSYSEAAYREELDRIRDRIRPLIKICKEYGTAIRIGTNHGSLSERIIDRFGDTPEGMVESALEFAGICEDLDFRNVVLSMKSSNVKVMVHSTRLLVARMRAGYMDYPIHLGVTEAGAGEDGILKSAIGIGTMLIDGIGDTIRVSLTGDPVEEIPVAYNLLQASRTRITKTEFIACPSCGRTQFDISGTLREVERSTGHLKGLKIAVMGCLVNGPGEMADADYGYVGAGKGLISLYRGKEIIKKNIPGDQAIPELLQLIRADGKWEDPPGSSR